MADNRASYDVELTQFAYGGDCIGRLPDGKAVFVPFCLPGERARVQVVEERRGYARAQVVELLRPAEGRIVPRCAHFGACGGCHYQHIPYPDQLKAKETILRDQLARIGGLEDVTLYSVPAQQAFNYRNHVQFHLNREGHLGYHRARSEAVLAISECHLPEETINEIWPQIELGEALELERIGLRAGAGGEVQLILESEGSEAPEFSVEELSLSAVFLKPDSPLVLAGRDYVVMEVLEKQFKVSAGSFFQVNIPMAERMIEYLLSRLNLTREITVLDGYCGVGLFSAFLAEQCGRLIGIESSASACADFVDNLDEFEQVELYEAPVEEVLPHLEGRVDVIVVDPPRTGLAARALDEMLRLEPQVMAYVSCDPATLARDAKKLTAGGYRLEELTAFDLFPQTYHIESISLWVQPQAG